MRRFFNNVPISRAAAVSFALLIIPISLVMILIIFHLNKELRQLEAAPTEYIFEIDFAEDPGPIRSTLSWLRSHSPFYEESSQVGNFLRDTRLFFILIWVGFTCLTLWVAFSLTRSLQAQLGELGRAINQLADQDLSKPIKIRGNANVQALSAELDSLRLMLEKTGQQQVQFLSHVAHEVKTPLASIREGIKLMNDELLGEINADQREVTEIIAKNSRALQGSLERLFDYNQAVALKSSGQRARTRIADLWTQTIEAQSLAIKAKALVIEMDLGDETVEVNPSQMLTVFENLLSNAIRYSPRGGVIAIAAQNEKNLVHITIQDEGPGIPVSQRHTVFNAFFTGTPPDGDELKGSGLGLSIARQYVELHQGVIELMNSSRGRLSGALIRVSLSNG